MVFLRKVIEPVRDEIFSRKPTPELSDLDASQSSMNSHKLNILVSLLCHNSPKVDKLSKPLNTISELIQMNSKKFFRPSRIPIESGPSSNSVIRHSRENEAEVSQYISIKLYSIIRSADLLQTIFAHGIFLSYSRILTLVDELSVTVLHLYQKSGDRVLPSNCKKGIFSVFIDDNLDKNSSSPTAKAHFHGAGVSILQFPTEKNLGVERIRTPFKDLSEASKLIDISLIDKYANVLPCNVDLKKGFYPIQSVNIPQQFLSDISYCYQESRSGEMKWLAEVISSISDFTHHANEDMKQACILDCISHCCKIT